MQRPAISAGNIVQTETTMPSRERIMGQCLALGICKYYQSYSWAYQTLEINRKLLSVPLVWF